MSLGFHKFATLMQPLNVIKAAGKVFFSFADAPISAFLHTEGIMDSRVRGIPVEPTLHDEGLAGFIVSHVPHLSG
jgi:hypothetical protein